MNNFTKSDSESFWHAITNLTCCSIASRKWQIAIRAFMVTLFFAFSVGSMYAQKIDLPQQRSTFYPVCIDERPVGFSEEEIATLYASMCPDGTTAEVVKSETLSGNDCGWTTIYTYVITCGDFDDELKVTYEGGDSTAPELTGDAPGSESGLNLCYDEIPSGPTANEIAAIYSDDCGNVNVVKSGTPDGTDCNWSVTYTYTIIDDCGNQSPNFEITFSGGDTEAPTLGKGAILPVGETGLNLCYDDRPTGPTEEEIAALFEDNCGNINVDKVEYFKGDDCGWKGEIIYTITDDCGNSADNITLFFNGGDMEAPEFTEVPDDITVSCIDEVPSKMQLSFTDNCTLGENGKPLYAVSQDDVSGLGIACEGGVVIRTWTAVDNCGHSTSVTQTINVLPAPKAEFDVPQDYAIDCGDLATFQPQSLYYTNNVDGGACEISGYAVGVADDFTGSCGSFTVNYSFTDECGHTITASQTVTVEDNEAPIIDGGKNAHVECDGTGNVEEYNAWLAINGEATATDNCGSITWTYEEVLEENCGGMFLYYVDFTATDECGNSSVWKGIFHVDDTTAPELTDAQDMTVECDGQGNEDALNAWLASNGGATANDVCSDISWSNNFEGLSDDCGATGSATVEFTVTDSCGNSSKTTAIFTIEDTTAPSVVDAQDMTVECDGDGNIDALNAWLASNGGASASDDCSDVTWSNNFEDLSDDCGATGLATVEFTATDDCGNESKTTATFTIEDTNSPPITMSAQDMTVECDGQGNMNEYQAWLDNNGGATATDICSDITWSYQVMGETDDCGMTKTITVLFTVTDDCGLSSSTEGDFIIEDTTSPEITEAQDVTVECKASTDNRSAEITIEAWLDNNGGATASDLCGDVTWTNNFNGLSDDCGNTGSATVEFTATDSCGNESKTTAIYTIVDTTAPSIEIMASDLTVECDGLGNQWDLLGWLGNNGGASAYDICGDVTWSNNFDALSDDCGATGSATVEFTATDDCGNESKTTATFTIEDTTAPDVTDAQDMTVECDGSGNQEDLMMWLDNNGGATANDICSDVTWSNNFDALSDDCGATGSATVEFTATDDCGNESKTTATFTIEDTTAPDVIDAQDMIVECDGQGNYYDLESWLLSNGGASASDTCSDVVWSHNFDMLSDDCGATGSATVEFTATDDCGNSSKTTATFTIEDTTAPGFEVTPQDMTVECDGEGNTEDLNAWLTSNGGGYAYDICSDVVWSHNFDMLSDDCGATGSATVEFTVTDDCGNETKATATFTIEDTTNPSIDYHSKTEIVECDGQGNLDELNAWLASNGGAMASDYCGDVSWTNDFNSLSDECGMTGSVTVVFTVADECGNTSKTQADFIIEDTTAPELIDAQDMTVECDGQGNLDELNAWLASNGGATASDICGDVTWSNNFDVLSDDCGMTGSATVEFTATDACGNSSKTTATFTIEDTTAPGIGIDAKPEIAECDGQGNIDELNAWLSDNGGATASDICGEVTWSHSEVVFSDDCGLTGTATVVFTATDACGNTNTTTSTFTIEDTTSPEITEAQDETVECSDGNVGGGDCIYAIELYDSYGDGWSGNSLNVEVDGVVVLSGITLDDGYGPVSFDVPVTHNDAIITVYQNDGTWSSENSYSLFDSEGTEVAEGDDDNDIEYQAYCPQPSSQELYEAWLANNGGATASDLCGDVTWTNNASGLSDECGMTGSETVEFTATDDCGNTSKTTATFTVVDTSAPVITAEAEDMTVECSASADNCSYSVVLSDTFGDGWNGNTLNVYVDGELVLDAITLDDGYESDSYSIPVTNGGTIIAEFVDCPAGDISCWQGETSFTIYDSNGNEVAMAEDGDSIDGLVAECMTSDDLFAAWLANNAGAMANDYCGDVTWSNNSQGLSDDCGATGTETVTFTVTDECGNTSTSTATFTVIDTTAPTIDMDAEDMTVECDGLGNTSELNAWLANNGGATASDTCSDVTWSNNFNGLSDDCGMTGSATVVFTATDECGNASATEATFSIEDTVAPTMDEDAKPEIVECDGQGNQAQLAVWLADNGGAKASDVCSDVTWSYSDVEFSDDCGLTGSATVVFTATDDCGNSVTTEATFTIEDTTAPTVVDAQDLIVECDGQGNVGDLNAWLANNGGATASDDCGDVTWTNNFNGLSDDCGMTGSATVVFTTTDECGNASTTEATFTIEDTTAPTIDYEAKPEIVECDGQGNQAELGAWLANYGGAKASDVCSDVVWSHSDVEFSDDCGLTGSATVVFTATDDCGNSVSTEATFTIEDTTAPDVVDAQDMIVECDGSGNISELNAWLANNGGATASDDCGDITWTNNFNGLSDDCGMTGSATVVFTATDECGNASTTEATFIIEDTVAPNMDEDAKPEIVECDGQGNQAQLAAWLADNGGAKASDVCSDVTWSHSEVEFSDDCGLTGSATVVFTATDDCGNSSSSEATFTIEDTTAPDVVDAQDMSVECDGQGNLADLEAWLANNGGATASDDCGDITWSNSCSGSGEITFDCIFPGGNIGQIAFGASTGTTNGYNDYPNGQASINGSPLGGNYNLVYNTQDNQWEVLENGNLLWYSAGNSVAPVCDIQVWATAQSVIDNNGCILDNVDCESSCELSDECGMTGSVTVDFTATDECGNATTTTATFTIVDTTAPNIDEEAMDMTVECDGQGNIDALNAWLADNGGASASDICSDFTWSNNFNGLSDDCGETGSATVEFTVTDECGNESKTTATFTIVDTTNPTIDTEGMDMTVECDGNGNVDELNAWLADNAGAMASDTCSGVTWSNNFDMLSDDCAATGSVTVEFTATDDCGNSAKTTATFTIEDTIAPVLVGQVPQGESNVDACFDMIPQGPTEAEIAALFYEACGEVVVEKTGKPLGEDCSWAVMYSYAVSDECGNSFGDVKVWYNGGDISAPTFNEDLPADMTVECDAVPNTAVLTATDNCADVIVELDEQIIEGDCKGEYTIVNTWTVADNCGNENSHVQTITVVDTMAPVLVGELPTGENQINSCLSGAPEGPTEEEIAALFSDACGDVIVVKETQTWGDDCSWIVNHEYTISDDCGNMYDGLIKVYYQGSDQNAPEFDVACQLDDYEIVYDCPADATISLSVGDEIDPYMGWTVAGQQIDPIGSCVNDDCTLTKDIILRVMDVTYGGDSCETDISISFEAEDACGNISEDWFTCTYVIKDETAPIVECPADENFGIDPSMDANGLPVGLADKAPYTDNCQGDGMTTDYTDSAITSVEEVIAPTEDFKFIFFNGGYEVNFGQPAGYDAEGYPYYVGDSYYSNDGSPYNVGLLELVYNANTGEYEMLQDGNVIGNGPEYLGYPDCNGTWNVEGNTHDKAHYLECGNPQSVTTYTMTRTFTATDACGNTGECSVIYTWSVSTATSVCGYQVVECGDSVLGNTADGGVEDVVNADNGLTGNWYTFIGTGQNMVVLSTCDATDYDSRIDIYTDCGNVYVTGNDDGVGCSGFSSEVSFYADAGVEYSIFVSGWMPTSIGNYELSVTCDVPPTAPEAPSNKIADEDVKLDFKAYPVPFDKEVTIGYNFDFKTNVTIEVYDTKGLLVMSETNNAYRAGSDASAKLDLSNGADQLFYVTVTTSQGSVTKKIVSSTLRKR